LFPVAAAGRSSSVTIDELSSADSSLVRAETPLTQLGTIRDQPSSHASPQTLRPGSIGRRQNGYARRNYLVSLPRAVTFEELNAQLEARCRRRFDDRLRGRWGGHIARFVGDGTLAFFGYPRAHEDDAERALRAGLELVGAVSHCRTADGAPLAVRMGIATGVNDGEKMHRRGGAKMQRLT
jgi:hypothetical protein